MELEARLIHIIAQSGSPSDALKAATAAIADDEHAHACGIFLVGPEGRPALWSRSGGGLDRSRVGAEALVARTLSEMAPGSAEYAGCALASAPLVSRTRPIGVLVVERGADRPFSAGEIRRLSAIASHVVGIIEDARLIELIEHVDELVEREAGPPREIVQQERVLHGVAASPGIVIGTCVLRQLFPRSLLRLDTALRGPEVERTRIRDAFEKTRNDLTRLESAVASELGEEEALVFGTHLMFLSDPLMQEQIERAIGAGCSAAVAVDRAREEVVRRLRLIGDPYIRERIEDLEDLSSRILGHLLGKVRPGVLHTRVVVSSRLTPSLIVELHGRGALGVASETGGATSHAVLLARALGLPVVTGIPGLVERANVDEPLVIDGDRGIVVVQPSAETARDYERRIAEREHARTQFEAFRDRAPVTADGVRFELQANVAFAVDIEAARENNAQGIGLYRTEFPFIVRDGLPTVEEQARIYQKAFAAFPAGPVVFRILDVAQDKLVPASGIEIASNPFHGYRSIRVLFDYPHVLRDQVQAFAIAAGGRPLTILIPMVTSVEEIRRVKQLVTSALSQHPQTSAQPPPRFGAMIEVPAAVEIATELAREADFFSIGTNDLIQYTLVVDRDDPRLSSPLDAFHPAILRMARRVVQAGHAAGKEVSVCGELAGRFEFAAAFLALGVDALSVTPRIIPELKQKLAQVAVRALAADMDRILELPTAAELQHAIRAHLG